MKKLKIVLCAMLLALSSLMFVACGPSEFNEENITFGQSTFTYDGETHIFDITYKDVNITTEYSLDGEVFGDKDTIAIVDVGTYTIYFKITADGYKEYVGSHNLVINNANLNEDTFVITNNTVTYNGFAQIFNVSYPNLTLNSVLYSTDEGADKTWKTREELNLIDPGTYQVYYKATATNYNEFVNQTPVTLTIQSLDWGDKVMVVNTTPVNYDGNSHMFNINVKGSMSSQKVLYRLKGESTWREKDTLNLVNAGTYIVEYKVTANGYSQPYTGEQTYIINKATLNPRKVTVTNANTVNYDSNEHMFDVTVDSSIAGAKVTYSIDNGKTWVNRNQVNFVNVGSYYVRFKVESLNYVNYESSVTYNINPITFDLTKITATNPIFTYDGTAKTFTAQYNGTILGGANVKVEYQVNDGEWTETPVSRIDVCQFSVKYRLSAANYTTETSNAITFVIQTASFEGLVTTENSDNVTFNKPKNAYVASYDGQAKMFNVVVSKDNTAIDGVVIKYSLDSTSNKNWVSADELNIKSVGTYTVYFQVSKSNYTTYTSSKRLIIEKAKFNEDNILFNGETSKNVLVTYNGTEQKPVVTYGGAVNYTVQYSLDNKTWQNDPVGYKDAGWNNQIYFKLTAENYNDYKGYFYLSINKAKFDINKILKTGTFTYDGNAHALVVSYDTEASFGEEITVEYKLYGENWTTDPITKTEVGSYKVIYRLKANNFETYDSSVEGPATHGNFEIVSK